MNKLTLMMSGLCFACSTGVPVTVIAASHNLVLDKVVTMTRHGVRSQSNTASVQQNSPTPIPVFNAKDGELTPHGYAAITLMGDYLHRQFVSQNFIDENTCPDAKNIFIRSSAFQRTRMTARALADTLFPGCAVTVHSPEKKTDDTLFEPIVSGMAPLNVEKATQSVMTSLGGDFDTARQRYASQIMAMQKVVDPTCQLTECTFVNHKWEIKADKQNINISLKGPIAKGSELGETFRLQYSEGMPIKDVAFGHVNQAYALEKGSGYKDPDASPQIRDSAPDARMVMYVAHDTNLGYLQPLLNVSWNLPGYPKDDTPPGSTLLFERYRDTKTQKIYVGVSFMTQTLDQMRRLETLSSKNPPLQQKLNLNCKNSPDGWLCPIDEFAAQVNSRLDKTAMIAQNYAE